MLHVIFRPLEADPKLVAAVPDWDRAKRRGVPVETVDSARAAYDGLLDGWAEAFSIRTSALERVVDVEDWTENAVKLIAAIRTGLPVHVVDRGDPASGFSISHTLGEVPFDPAAPAVFCGTVLRQDPLFASPYGDREPAARVAWPRRASLGGGERYWRSPVLLDALGRKAAVASGNDNGPGNYVDASLALLAAGARSLMAKIVFQAKYQGPTSLDMEDHATATDVKTAFFKAFDVNLIDCDGRPECFLVQERIEMEHEYRVVVIGGRPVAGSGAVDWLCPVFHDPGAGAFDPLVEGRRSSGSVSAMPDVVRRFREAAETICGKLETAGDTRFLDCTMDFAIDRDSGRVCLIETNPTDNYGLYAMDFTPVMEAMVHEAELEAFLEPVAMSGTPARNALRP